jgi:FtsH-binding integral membrane protein
LLAVRFTNFLWPFQLGPFWDGVKLFARGDFVLAFKYWHDFAWAFIVGALNPFVVLVVCLMCGWIVFRRGINPFENQKGLLVLAVGTYVTSVMLFALEYATVNHTWAYTTVLSLLMACALMLSRLPRTPLIVFLIAVAVFESGASYVALLVPATSPGFAPALFFNVALTILAFSLNLPGPASPRAPIV